VCGSGTQNALRTLATQKTAMLQSSRKEADSLAAITTAIAAKQSSIDALAAAERCVVPTSAPCSTRGLSALNEPTPASPCLIPPAY
jgi:hypothetical protein